MINLGRKLAVSKRHRSSTSMPSPPPLLLHSMAYKEAAKSYHVREHAQSFCQWCICVHGGITTLMNGRKVDLDPGQSIVYRPGTRREPRCRGRAPGYLIADFTDTGLGLEPICDQVLTLPPNLREDLLALVAELVQPAGSDAGYLRVALLVRLLIGQRRATLAAMSSLALRPALNAQAAESLVEAAEAFMQANLQQSLDRTVIAAAAHCSVPHLGRLFRTVRGCTVRDRLQALRLERARILLRDTPDSIGQVAVAVGFASFSHFARAFRAATGLAPSDFRRAGGAVWLGTSDEK